MNGYQVTVSGVNALGQTFDTTTYNFSPDTTPPTAPSNLQASAPSGNRVDLTWTASTDAKGVAAYDVYRNGGGTPIATVDGDVTAFSDTTVSPNTQYSYVVKARDPSNNTSDPSNTADVTTPSSDGPRRRPRRATCWPTRPARRAWTSRGPRRPTTAV